MELIRWNFQQMTTAQNNKVSITFTLTQDCVIDYITFSSFIKKH